MNEDHANAVVLYAQVFGDCPEAEAARMLAIDPEGMDLAVEVAGKEESLRINFEHPLKDAEDAHHTLIAMVKEARQGQRQP
jgi:putative heme iron utilization protein